MIRRLRQELSGSTCIRRALFPFPAGSGMGSRQKEKKRGISQEMSRAHPIFAAAHCPFRRSQQHVDAHPYVGMTQIR